MSRVRYRTRMSSLRPRPYRIVANGKQGAVTITNPATGAFTYTPNPGAGGIDRFTFRVSDGAVDSNVATVVVTIARSMYLPIVRR